MNLSKKPIQSTSVFSFLLSLFFVTCFCGKIYSQSIEIKGTVLDSLQEPMVGASVVLKHAADDKMEAFAIANKQGAFRLSSDEYGEFVLQITYIGYGTFERPLTLKEGEGPVDFGEIVLHQSAYALDGVTVEESFIPIIIKKDTIEYNAAAFKTRPNATVEDLLKKLPGVEVERDGTIKAQGEEVENVLVDGKEFFDDDPKIATRNIPADVVDKVQVFDKKSEFSEFTGIDDGEEAKTINLAIKEGKNKGWFGDVKGAYGTEKLSDPLGNRYKASTSINRFNKDMQLSVVGSVNNINEQAFSLMDYLKFSGGLDDLMSGGRFDFSDLPINLLDQAGSNDLYSGGVNFNYDFGKKTELRSNYFYNLSQNITQNKSTIENILNEGSYTNRSAGTQSQDLANHRLSFKLKHQLDDSQDFTAKINAGFSDIDGQQTSLTDALINETTLVNQSDNYSTGNSELNNWNSDFLYRKKLKKKGRFFTGRLGLKGKDESGSDQLMNRVSFYENSQLLSIDSIDQLQNEKTKSLTYSGKINYVEPLGKANYLNFSISSEVADDDRKKNFYDQTEPGVYKINDLLSSDFKRDYNQNRAGIGYKRMRDKYTLSLGLDYQLLTLDNKDQNGGEPFSKDFKGLLPTASYRYQFGKATQLSARYNTFVQAPDLEQLQPVVDNSSLTNIYVGNPDLSAEYIHALDLNFNHFDQFYFRSLFFGFNMQYVHDRISDQVSITDELLRITQPVNGDDAWRMSLYYDYSSPIQGKNFKFSVGGDYSLERSNVLANDLLDQAHIATLTQRASIENKKKDKIDWKLGTAISPNITRYKTNDLQNQNFFDYRVTADLVWFIKDSWYFTANYEREAYSSATFSEATAFNFVDASLNKTFKDDQFTLSLKGMNLLNENQLVKRNSLGSQYQEAIRDRLGRYFLVGLTYKIRSFGK